MAALVRAVVLAFCVALMLDYSRPPALKKKRASLALVNAALVPKLLVNVLAVDALVQAVELVDPATTAELLANVRRLV